MTALTDVVTGNTALASDINQLVDRLNRIAGDTGSVQIAGGTSGTATCYQIFQETLKITVISLNNFRTAGSTQNITLPVAYASGALVIICDGEAMSLQLSGTDQTFRDWTALPASTGAAGTTVSATSGNQFNIIWMNGGFDTVQFKSGWTAAHNGLYLMVGK